VADVADCPLQRLSAIVIKNIIVIIIIIIIIILECRLYPHQHQHFACYHIRILPVLTSIAQTSDSITLTVLKT